MTALTILSVAQLLCLGYLVYLESRRFDRAAAGEPPGEFTPIAVWRRFRDPRPVERPTISRLSRVKASIEQEEKESQRTRVIS